MVVIQLYYSTNYKKQKSQFVIEVNTSLEKVLQYTFEHRLKSASKNSFNKFLHK